MLGRPMARLMETPRGKNGDAKLAFQELRPHSANWRSIISREREQQDSFKVGG